MLRNTLITLITAAATSSAGASMIINDFTASGFGQGTYAGLGQVTMKLTLQYDNSASVLAPAFGSWSLTVSQGISTLYSASGNALNALTYKRFTSATEGVTRRYTAVLGNSESANWSGIGSPAPTMIEIGYAADRTVSGGYGTLGDSLAGLTGTNEGYLVVLTNATPGSFGSFSSSGYTVPAPGATVLVVMAGLVANRRRRS